MAEPPTNQAHGCVTQDFARITQENFMGQRTIGIDLAIRGDHVARIFDGRPHAKPISFRLTSESLSSLVARLRERLPAESTITAVMEPTGMSWFPVARWLERAEIKAIRVKGQRVRALRRLLWRQSQLGEQFSHRRHTKPNGEFPFDQVGYHRPRPQAKIQAIPTRITAVDPTEHLTLLARRQIAAPPGRRPGVQRSLSHTPPCRRAEPSVDRRAIEAIQCHYR
jgi:hypothetical protein